MSSKKLNLDKVKDDVSVDKIDENNIDFVARFACLMYGVNVAADAAERLGMNPDKNNKWIKPIVFQKYIDERYEDMKFNIKRHLKGDDVETYSW
jgi:hypothetical protein